MRKTVPIQKVKENPNNPRVISDIQFERLKKSIQDFPEMLDARPLILTPDMVVVGGNMRLAALKALGHEKVKVDIQDWTPDQVREFVVKDNLSYGEWDMDLLLDDYEEEQLEDWGFEFDNSVDHEADDALPKATKEPVGKWVPDCIFQANNIYDIPTLQLDLAADRLDVPFSPWGYKARDAKGGGTYHFYVDDYRFEAVWDNPNKVYESGCYAIVEPNLSCYDNTPTSWGIFQIYKKRWIARYLQTLGVRVFVDMNVSGKFAEYNLMGVPDGWNAFATRGYAMRPEGLELEYQLAQKVSGKKEPFFVVYGGGKKVKEIAAKFNCIYIEQIMSQISKANK